MTVRRIAALAAALFICAAVCAMPVLAVEGYTNGKHDILVEEGIVSQYLKYYRDGGELPLSEMTWTEGHSGRGLYLAENEYLQLDIYRQMQVNAFTVSAWIKWDGMRSSSPEGQALFTLMRNEPNRLRLSPWYCGTAFDGGAVNGVYVGLECHNVGVTSDLYHDVSQDTDCYALPAGAWHHVALTSDGTTLMLYIDGQLLFSETLMVRLRDLNATKMIVGGSMTEGGACLRATLDDVAIYEYGLSAEVVAQLAQGSTTDQLYYPTAPEVQPDTEPLLDDGTAADTLFGMPRWLIITLAVFLGAGLIALVVVSAAKGGSKR